MEGLGLKEISVRLNDRVHFVSPKTEEHTQQVKDFMESSGWDGAGEGISQYLEEKEPQIRALMSRGMDRKDAEEFLEQDMRLARFFEENRDEVSFTSLQGALITFGRKEKRAQDASHAGSNA